MAGVRKQQPWLSRKRCVVVLDLDHTLLNTSALKFAMLRNVRRLGVPGQVFWRTYKATVRRYADRYDYDIHRHAKLIAKQVQGTSVKTIAKELHVAEQHIRTFLFADALPFLEFLQKLPATTILLSHGNRHTQAYKIRRLHIAPYFHHIVIVEEKKHTAKLPLHVPANRVVFVNDNAAELRSLYPRYRAGHFVLLDRRGALRRRVGRYIRVVHSLRETHKVLRRLAA